MNWARANEGIINGNKVNENIMDSIRAIRITWIIPE